MTVRLIKHTHIGSIYCIYDPAGRPIGQVEWKMAGPDVGQYFYSFDPKYKPARLRKIYRAAIREGGVQ